MHTGGLVAVLGALGLVTFASDEPSTPAPNPGAGPPLPRETDWDKVDSLYCVEDAVSEQKGVDVMADVQPSPLNVATERAALQTGQATEGASPFWYEAFHRQVELPASRIIISQMQPYHFQLANSMLTGGVSRSDQAGNLYKDLLDQIAQNKKTASDLAIANTAIGVVAAFIPVVGGAIKIAVGTGLSEGQKGATQNAQNETQALQALSQIGVGLGVGSPEGKMWLSNEDSTSPPESKYVYGADVFTQGLSSESGYYAGPDGKAVWQYLAVDTTNDWVNGSKMIRHALKPGYSFVPVGGRMRLYGMHRYGWLLPWLSPQLHINESVEKRVGIRAAVLRAFDVMSTLLFPIDPPADGMGDSGRYWYNSVMGPLMGCRLPPTKENTTLSWNGRLLSVHGADVTKQTTAAQSTLQLSVSQIERKVGSNVAAGQQAPAEAASPPVAEDYGTAPAQTASPSSVAGRAGRFR